jgi:hypothetical protein
MQIENIQITITPYGDHKVNYQLYDLAEHKVIDRGNEESHQKAALTAIAKAEQIVQQSV